MSSSHAGPGTVTPQTVLHVQQDGPVISGSLDRSRPSNSATTPRALRSSGRSPSSRRSPRELQQLAALGASVEEVGTRSLRVCSSSRCSVASRTGPVWARTSMNPASRRCRCSCSLFAARDASTRDARTGGLELLKQPDGSGSSPLTSTTTGLAAPRSAGRSRRWPGLHGSPPGLAVLYRPGADLVGGNAFYPPP